jgi:outer membrane protein OmpA-like peptidoglycan-associated protein
MDSVIKLLRANAGYTISIAGHAYKTEGIPSMGDKLARERARIVKDYFQSRYVPPSRIRSVESHGSRRPINAGRNPREILRNSRAEIILYTQPLDNKAGD